MPDLSRDVRKNNEADKMKLGPSGKGLEDRAGKTTVWWGAK